MASQRLLIGIDLGTSSVKVAATDTAGFSTKEIELVRHYRAIRSDDMREHLLRLTRIISEQNLSDR